MKQRARLSMICDRGRPAPRMKFQLHRGRGGDLHVIGVHSIDIMPRCCSSVCLLLYAYICLLTGLSKPCPQVLTPC